MKLANVAEQYKNFPELKKKNVDEILAWVEEQPQFPKITELEAIIFYHSNYCKMEETKTTIRNYFTCRTDHPEFFSDRNVLGDELEMATKTWLMSMLPQPTEEGNRVIFAKLMDKDPKNFSLNAAMKLFSCVSDAFLSEEGVCNGFIIVVDFDGLQFGHLLRMGVMSFKNYLYYLQEALPVRMKGFYFINVNKIIEKVVFMIKPFMKKELRDVFQIHTDPKTLNFDARILPSNYENGTARTVEDLQKQITQHLIDVKDFFLEEEKTRRLQVDREKADGKWGFFGY